MKILAVSDLHSEEKALETLERMEKENKPDLTLILGDSAIDSTNYAERMLEITKPEKTLTINGNNDYQQIQKFFEDKNVSIDNKIKKVDKFTFMGFGSSPHGPFHTINEKSEDEIEKGLERLFHKTPENEKIILATHAPPLGVLDEWKGVLIGSASVRKIIEKHQPLVNFCGHVHQTQGTEKIGETLVIKVASLAFRKAALLDTNTIKAEFISV